MTPPLEPDRIDISLDEDHMILTEDITTLNQSNLDKINSIVGKAIEADSIRKLKADTKANKQTAEDKQMDSILLSMLESPSGITKSDILVAAESESFIGSVNKFRAYLRRKNVYSLKKKTVDKQVLYVLDPIR